MNIVLRNLLEITSLFFISLILFTWGLNATEVVGFESRFYLFALEMWRNGASLFPTTYHQPYPDYPAASTFLIVIFAKFFGHMDKLIAVMPSAIAAAVTVTMTYSIGALHRKRWGIFAVFFLFCTFTFLKTARSIELDMYSAMVTALCFYLIYSGDWYRKPSRIYWIYPLLLLGFAFRGPIGLIIPAGVVCSYYLLETEFKRFFIFGLSALFLLLACTALLLFSAYCAGGKAFMQDVLRMQVIGRIDNAFLPIYFYFTNSLKNYALSFPLAALTCVGLIFFKTKKSSEYLFLLKLIAWTAIILLGMSLPGDKKIRYVLAIIPATSLLAAYIFVAQTNNYFKLIRAILLRFFLYLPILFLVTLGYFWVFKNKDILSFIHAGLIVFLLSAQLINVFIFYYYAKRKEWREFFILFIATFVFVVTYINLIEPIEMHVDQAKQFVKHIESARINQNAALVFYKERPDGLPIKYLINTSTLPKPFFIENQKELNQFTPHAFFITSKTYYVELPAMLTKNFRVIAQDKLGHIPVVVFTKKEKSNE